MKIILLWIYYIASLFTNMLGGFLNLTVGQITGKNYNNPDSIIIFLVLLTIFIIVFFLIKKLFTMKG